MYKSSGLLFEGKRYWSPYNTSAPPSGLLDASRHKNHVISSTDVFWTQLPNGLWVRRYYKATSTENCGSDFIGVKAITFVGWIKPTGWGGLGFGRLIDNGKFDIHIAEASTETGPIHHHETLMCSSNGNISPDGYKWAADYAIVLNTWTMCSITRTTAGVVNFYINGSPSGTPNVNAGTPVAGITSVYFGNRADGLRTFVGDQNMFRVYDYIFSSDQIEYIYIKEKALYGK